MRNSMRGAEIDWVVYSKKDGTHRGVTSNTRIYRIDKFGGVKKEKSRRNWINLFLIIVVKVYSFW